MDWSTRIIYFSCAIPGSDSCKANQICYNNYLPPYVIDQHHMNQPMLMCLKTNNSADRNDSMTDATSKLHTETKEFVKDCMDYLISSCDTGHITTNDYYTLHDELKLNLWSENSLTRNNETSMTIQTTSRIFIDGATATRTRSRTIARSNARNTTRTTTTTTTKIAIVVCNFITR